MNNTLRNEIARIERQITPALTCLKQAREILVEAKDEEESKFADASEGKQNGDWGQESQACTEAMQTLIDTIDSVDLSEEMDELGRAIDRSLEAPKGCISKAEAEQRRHDRLPAWAKEALARAEQVRDSAIEESKAKFEDWQEGSKKPTFSVYDGPLKGKEIPTDRVFFPQVEIEVFFDPYYGAIQLYGKSFGGFLTVFGNGGNTMFAKMQDHGGHDKPKSK